ncbi:MAG: hypothetical protein WAM69_08780, partial [Candidatus Sulfotelmatobacter sp.]
MTLRIFILTDFHNPHVTSDLVLKTKSRNHGRGRDGQPSLDRRASKSFVLPILVSKSFRLRILPGF